MCLWDAPPHAHACTHMHTHTHLIWAELRARLHSFFSCHSEVTDSPDESREGTPGGCAECRGRPAQAGAGPAPEPQAPGSRADGLPSSLLPSPLQGQGPLQGTASLGVGQGGRTPSVPDPSPQHLPDAGLLGEGRSRAPPVLVTGPLSSPRQRASESSGPTLQRPGGSGPQPPAQRPRRPALTWGLCLPSPTRATSG